MKKIFITITILLSYVFLFLPSAEARREWYVSTSGNDTSSGSIQSPFYTIQRAIDAANDEDIIIVMAGRHKGPGNRNLNFLGKAITVRSRNPDDNECLRATIIDAEGQGVIVRFVYDEGPDSVFEGFTLGAGDTLPPVQGVSGFFEFSDNARPTTRRLRLLEESLPEQSDGEFPLKPFDSLPKSQILSAEEGLLLGKRLWDGNNPFHHPYQTTDYHGSGDVDADGALTFTDVSLAQDMANGLTVPSSRADVDGNGVVNADDVFIINSALNDGILPAWWNSLTVRAQRISWIDKILTIDQTDRHPYVRGWFVCGDFSTQTFIHAAYYRDDLNHTQYNGGQTRFNLPMYSVQVPGHAINGILVGEDPLNFDEWLFFEPQNDLDVHPGMWNMPYGGHVKVRIPTGIRAPGSGGSFSTKLDFYVDESGWALEEYSPDLLTTRPAPIVLSPDNHPDLWNPMVVPENPKMIAFEQIRDDMLRVTDIHLAELPLMDSPMDTPLVMDSQYSRLLDISKGPDGTFHLLWKGKAEYIPGVFHAELNPLTREISRVTRVSEGTRMVREGRVIVTPGGEVHVFWLEDRKNIVLQYSTGIYWTRWTGSEWQPSENLTPGMISNLFETLGDPRGSGWIRDFLRHYFDVAVLHDGDIILIWAEPLEIISDVTEIRQLHYDGQWGSPTVIAAANARGVELLTDSAGTLHLVYWNGKVPIPWNGEGGRGTLVHLTYDGDLWSASEIVDNSGGACCPRMVAGENSEIYMIWERKEGEQVIPVWNKYEDGGWHDAQTIGVRPGADAWYPTVEILPDGAVVSAWSSRCPDHVTIGSEIMVQPLVEITYVSTDSKKYSITKAELGAKPYTDRDYAITEISSGLDKGIIVQTANQDKMVTDPAHLKLRLNMDAVVFVCYDKRGVDQDHNPPPCINEWRYCIESISTDDLPASPLVVFTRDVTAGEEITLGGNHYGGDTGALSNYFVVIKTKMCKGDFDWDRDVDGSDLASYIADPAGIILNEFAAEFGRNNCQF